MLTYVSVDIETTGLSPETCQVLEFGAVVATTEGKVLGEFHRYVQHALYTGEPYALGMHAAIFKRLAKPDSDAVNAGCLGAEFRAFLADYGLTKRVYAAGKNFASFDLQFLKRLPSFEGLFHHRHLDPAMLYFRPEDEQVPDLATCKARAGLGDSVAHTALEDARDVVDLITIAMRSRA